MCGHQRFIVMLVMLLAVSITYDAAFAKGGTLHLFSSDRAAVMGAIASLLVRLPIVSEPGLANTSCWFALGRRTATAGRSHRSPR